ncbi:TolC family protein [Chiayiivirga flava]|uniref:Cobalt-zinc-cadmium efflux system outer membrane protein n=1 Tax=Chiayiivirga flava TaxID=659595 RepID=A0A7W8D6P4_9GAMM|nr:TolC family protein [Chiayiivirga flava]MBB5208931.1 cobalt-zinc-cadmium efflux system outer membrane protein [Chiayiivirga flava]
MLLRPTTRAAVWAGLLASCVASAQSPATLRLEDAFERTLSSHPSLQRFALQQDALRAEALTAAQRPPLVVGASLENALGTGDTGGLGGAELSVTVGSSFEPRARRQARVAVVDARVAAVDVQIEAERLDLLAGVARRFVEAAAAQTEVEALRTHVAQRQATVEAAARRVRAGASPQSVQLTAAAALARAELELDRARVTARAARRTLALSWGERDPGFDRVATDLLRLPVLPSFAELARLLERTPELRKFASETRVREARVQLARTQSRPDVAWEAGVRRLQDTGDTAFLGSVSIALGSQARAAPGIRSAEAELEALAFERDAGALMLYATLAEASGRAEVEALAVQRAESTILPALSKAEASARSAYQAGALTYLEWAQLQADWLAARRDQIAAARSTHLALIEIQRLTATPVGAWQESTP